jgi:hypothetical protein
VIKRDASIDSDLDQLIKILDTENIEEFEALVGSSVRLSTFARHISAQQRQRLFDFLLKNPEVFRRFICGDLSILYALRQCLFAFPEQRQRLFDFLLDNPEHLQITMEADLEWFTRIFFPGYVNETNEPKFLEALGAIQKKREREFLSSKAETVEQPKSSPQECKATMCFFEMESNEGEKKKNSHPAKQK